MRLEQFDYILPPELIAQTPATPRDAARLMVVHRDGRPLEHRVFRDLPDYLRAGDALVLNDTRVLPARLRAQKATGASVEVLLLRARDTQSWETLMRPARRVHQGTLLHFPGGLVGRVSDVLADGVRVVAFASADAVRQLLDNAGEVPLPPYIHTPLRQPDDYQTVYAAIEGAVAAPTAGLHFTDELLERIRGRGVTIVTLTMHVGLGTFQQIRAADVERHHMAGEWYKVRPEAASALNAVRAARGRIVVVGTSTVRTLETVAQNDGTIHPGEGESELFIYPGYRFKATDALVTNFHLPKTTLLLLVAAFAGRDRILHAYNEAIRCGYRFYSFGDAMLLS